MKSRSVLAPLLLMLFMLPARSFATTLYFDEFGTSSPLSVDGLRVFGVTFGFSLGTADYNGHIGTSGSAVLVSDPLLAGPTTGTLTLAFDTPTPLLQFDLVLHLRFSLHSHSFQWGSAQRVHRAAAPWTLFGRYVPLHRRAHNRSHDHVF
jgi:hypothetical protein